MKTAHAVSLAAITGAIIGAAAISALHAQGAKPSYAVVDISEVTDPGGVQSDPEQSHN